MYKICSVVYVNKNNFKKSSHQLLLSSYLRVSKVGKQHWRHLFDVTLSLVPDHIFYFYTCLVSRHFMFLPSLSCLVFKWIYEDHSRVLIHFFTTFHLVEGCKESFVALNGKYRAGNSYFKIYYDYNTICSMTPVTENSFHLIQRLTPSCLHW